MLKKVRVLIVDDSALMRREISRIIEETEDLEVVATARNGQEVLDDRLHEQADVITLDINMPKMDGLTTLQNIMLTHPKPVIMVSSLTQNGALTTYEALNLGAVDWIGKPSGTVSADINVLKMQLIEKIRNSAGIKIDRVLKSHGRRARQAPSMRKEARPPTSSVNLPVQDLVIIGQSTGGPNAIMEVLPLLPADFPAPIVIVQHMPPSFTPAFAARLDNECALRVLHAEDNTVLKAGSCYVAPGGFHSLIQIDKRSRAPMIRLTEKPDDTLHRPSIDVTMMSAIDVFRHRVTAILLTGMGKDGALAMKAIRDAGGYTIAESEETAVIFGMPKEAIRLGGASDVLPVHAIAEVLKSKFYKRRVAHGE